MIQCMRRSACAALVLSMVPLVCLGGASGITVKQLAEMLGSSRVKASSDDATADRIARVGLTERLTAAALSRLSSGVGQRTAAALELLADRSAFLNPPPDEIPSAPPPSAAEQHAIVEKAEAYTLSYVKELPSVVCTRVVSRFDDLVAHGHHGELRLQDTLTGELTVRDGAESFLIQNAGILTAAANRVGDFEQTPNDFATSGEFGSILAELFVGHTVFAWRRWETLDGKRVAVAGYSVPREGSLLTVSWCCLGPSQSSSPWTMKPAYQGEISIDPASGRFFASHSRPSTCPKDSRSGNPGPSSSTCP